MMFDNKKRIIALERETTRLANHVTINANRISELTAEPDDNGDVHTFNDGIMSTIKDISALFDQLVLKNDEIAKNNKHVQDVICHLTTDNQNYKDRMVKLEEQVWILTNPSKFECGDTVALGRTTSEMLCKVVKKKPCLDTITNEYHWGYLLTDPNGKLMDDDYGIRGMGQADGDVNYWDESGLYVPVEAQVMPELDPELIKSIKAMEKKSKKDKKKKLLKG